MPFGYVPVEPRSATARSKDTALDHFVHERACNEVRRPLSLPSMRDWLNRTWHLSRLAGRDALIVGVIALAIMVCAFCLALLINLKDLTL